MTSLQPLVQIVQKYTGKSFSTFGLYHNGANLMHLELHRPEIENPMYFSATWRTSLNRLEGTRNIAALYHEMRNRLKVTKESSGLEYYQQKYGDLVEAEIIIGIPNSSTESCFKNDIVELGLKMEDKLESFSDGLMVSPKIPNFGFIRLNSPYCGMYFGASDEAGMISEFNLSHYVLRFFESTSAQRIPIQHRGAIEAKLGEFLWQLPRPELR